MYSRFKIFLKVIANLRHLINPRRWAVFVDVAEKTHFDHPFEVSWAQGAEDLALLHLFSTKQNGRYLDIGAHHPSRFSVTRHLYQRNWTGINVDANPTAISEFQVSRPKDVSILCAVGLEPTYFFTIFEEPAISTANTEWRERFLSENQQIKEEYEVQGRTLREILEQYFPNGGPDLLNIDIEGNDLEALQSAQFNSLPKSHWPRVICIETKPELRQTIDEPVIKYLLQLGYQIWTILPMSTLLILQL